MATFVWLLIFIFLLIPTVRAELAGRVRLESSQTYQSQKAPVSSHESALTLEMESTTKLSKNWRLRLEPKVRFSSQSQVVDVPIDGDFRETQFEGRSGLQRYQVGSLVKVWEGTDGLNPMDLASMKNYRDPLRSENLGSWGLGWAGGQKWTWDFIYVPWQTRSRLPGEKSGWWPRRINIPLQQDDVILVLPNEPQYRFESRSSLNDSQLHNFGGRLQLHGEETDFSLAAFEGAAQTPILQPTINGEAVDVTTLKKIQILNPIMIRPIDYRRRSLAAGLVWNQGSWIYRVAARHDQPLGKDSRLPTWSDQWVAGLEKTVSIRDQNVIFIFQGAFGHQPESASVASASDLFRQALLYGFRWPWSEELNFLFAGFYDTKHSAHYHRFSIQRKWTDSWLIDGSADILDGPADNLLGVWSDQGRASVGVTFQY